MTNHTENSTETNEAQEVKNQNNTQFDFTSPILSFIETRLQGKLEGKLEGKLNYFSYHNYNDNWIDFIKFLSNPNSPFSHDIIKSFQDGKDEKYLAYLNHQIIIKTYPIEQIVSQLEKLFRTEFEIP